MKTPAASSVAFLLALAASSSSSAQPVLISPGHPERSVGAASSCPTFSWGAAANDQMLELLVFSVEGDAGSTAALREILPAGATSWTPSDDACLRPGRYAWTIRVASGEPTTETRPRFFTVRVDDRSRVLELEASLRNLERRLAHYETAAAVSPAPIDDPAEPVDAADARRTGGRESESPGRLAEEAFVPPGCTGTIFDDVSGGLYCPWIEQAYNDGLVGACAAGRYCPTGTVTRQQLAVFLEKTKRGPAGGALTGDYPNPGLAASFRLPQSCANDATAIWNGSTWNCGTPFAASIPFHVAAHGGHWGEMAGPGIGGTGATGVVGWANTGMFGYGDTTGVWGETGVSSGVGVRGNAWAGGLGVLGFSGGGNYGVYGESISGRGVGGYASATSGPNYGVWGQTASALGIGVYGRSNTVTGLSNGFVGSTGVWGDSGVGVGVFGTSTANSGIAGFSETGSGVSAVGNGSNSAAALTVSNGKLRVSGLGPAFVHTVHTAGINRNTCDGGNGHFYSIIDHPYANFEPTAMLFVLARNAWGNDQIVSYAPFDYGDCSQPGCCPAGHWLLNDTDSFTDQIDTGTFNILIINQ